MNELKMVNDRKNLSQKVFSERDNKNYNYRRAEFNTSSRAFKQIKDEKYLKFINEINEENPQENFFKIINISLWTCLIYNLDQYQLMDPLTFCSALLIAMN